LQPNLLQQAEREVPDKALWLDKMSRQTVQCSQENACNYDYQHEKQKHWRCAPRGCF
jgi:hypothetical protein